MILPESAGISASISQQQINIHRLPWRFREIRLFIAKRLRQSTGIRFDAKVMMLSNDLFEAQGGRIQSLTGNINDRLVSLDICTYILFISVWFYRAALTPKQGIAYGLTKILYSE